MKSSIDNHKIFRSGSKKDINVIKSLVSEEIKVLCQWGSEARKFGIKWVTKDKVSSLALAKGSRDGEVVIALAFHRCIPGSIPDACPCAA